MLGIPHFLHMFYTLPDIDPKSTVHRITRTKFISQIWDHKCTKSAPKLNTVQLFMEEQNPTKQWDFKKSN